MDTEVGTLLKHLKEVFNLTPLLQARDGDGIFISTDKLDKIDLEADNEAIPRGELFSPFAGRFPGALIRDRSKSPHPPPNVLAFYLPFRYFYPTWWGNYLLHESVRELLKILHSEIGRSLSCLPCIDTAGIFLVQERVP